MDHQQLCPIRGYLLGLKVGLEDICCPFRICLPGNMDHCTCSIDHWHMRRCHSQDDTSMHISLKKCLT
jgi:hypothetical protein